MVDAGNSIRRMKLLITTSARLLNQRTDFPVVRVFLGAKISHKAITINKVRKTLRRIFKLLIIMKLFINDMIESGVQND